MPEPRPRREGPGEHKARALGGKHPPTRSVNLLEDSGMTVADKRVLTYRVRRAGGRDLIPSRTVPADFPQGSRRVSS